MLVVVRSVTSTYSVGVALALVVVIFVLFVAIASVGLVGLRRWYKDPTMPKRLPGFNIFTGRWSDEKPPPSGDTTKSESS